MGYLSNDEFFSRLAELFNAQKGKEHGAIYLTQRRLDQKEPAGSAAAAAAANGALPSQPPQPQTLLVRASNGKSKRFRKDKVRLATTVDPEALVAFYARYAETCKAGMTLLKPRDKSKKKAKAKKKKAAATTPAAPAL
ncbi:signal recognition particle [Niveomyces insectorum RCEF 264]|uniref:Signal recognition particle subunit SRP14 n=1 Tax=Niveomyces insectorum RCEF 264 TaxID=1081102 RepID=A0A167ML95_9HYPO|nr:signal recognition particle [Niveomyces insectorum RCEF 264]